MKIIKNNKKAIIAFALGALTMWIFKKYISWQL